MNAKLSCGKDELDRDWNDLDIFAIGSVVGSPPMGSTGLVGFRQRSAPDRDCFRSEGLVRVIHGARDLFLPVVGKTVGEVRTLYREFLNFASAACAFLGGGRVGDGEVIPQGSTLEFLNLRGRKGVGKVWKGADEICEAFGLTQDRFRRWREKGLPLHEFDDGTVLLTETDFDAWSAFILGLNAPLGAAGRHDDEVTLDAPYLSIKLAAKLTALSQSQ